PTKLAFLLAALIWTTIARIVGGSFLSLREKEYVEAARAAGSGDVRIMFRHMLPNTVGPIVVAATLTIGTAILLEAVLSFLGSGKSVRPMSILGLIPQPPRRIVRGEALFKGTDLLKLSKKQLRRVRGEDVAMVFQDPMTSLNPVLKIGYQIGEAIRAHHPDQR